MNAALRLEHHQRGRKFMLEENYFQALDIFQETLVKYGPHVGLLSDILAVYYLLGRIEESKKMINQIESELVQAEGLLSTESFVRTKIFLGKMLEEQAQVNGALICYQEATERSTEPSELQVKAQTQLLRLKSFLGQRAGLAELYQACNRARTDSFMLLIEFEHALLLAEIVLFGTDSAKTRVQDLLQNEDLLSGDRRLLVFDYSEEVLRQNLDLKDSRDWVSTFSEHDLDEFEKILRSFILDPQFVLNSKEVNKLTAILPLMSLFKVLILNLKRVQDESLRLEMKRRFTFLLESVSTESKILLLKKWPAETSAQNKTIKFDLRNCQLILTDKNISFKKDSFAVKCFQSFKQANPAPMDDFIQNVFSATYDVSYFDRSRIAIQRLNKELEPLIGIPKLFLISKTQVELASGFEIIFIDEKV